MRREKKSCREYWRLKSRVVGRSKKQGDRRGRETGTTGRPTNREDKEDGDPLGVVGNGKIISISILLELIKRDLLMEFTRSQSISCFPRLPTTIEERRHSTMADSDATSSSDGNIRGIREAQFDLG
ncbi:hypothetical protein ACLOJK_022301 [Asimina triloba]